MRQLQIRRMKQTTGQSDWEIAANGDRFKSLNYVKKQTRFWARLSIGLYKFELLSAG
jgi:hypothetical protein